MDPSDIAHIFVDDVLSTQSARFVIQDSYTDSKNTGVTHVYVCQLVNGLEVTGDGDMNINIKDGVVLSYGTLVCFKVVTLTRVIWN